MGAYPCRKIDLGKLPRRQIQHYPHDLRLRRDQKLPVETQEHVHRHEGNPLVAIDVPVILRQTIPIGGSKIREIGIRMVPEPMLRARKRRLDQPFVPCPERTAMVVELIGMNYVQHPP